MSKATYAEAVKSLVESASGRDLTKVSGLWDTLAGFAGEVGMEFPSHRRDAIMTAAGTLSARGKGVMTGSSSVTRYRASIGEAWKAAVTHAEGKGASKEALKAWGEDWGTLSAVSCFAKGCAKLKFEV